MNSDGDECPSPDTFAEGKEDDSPDLCDQLAQGGNTGDVGATNSDGRCVCNCLLNARMGMLFYVTR